MALVGWIEVLEVGDVEKLMILDLLLVVVVEGLFVAS
jgi:hypothetical protein